MNAYRSLILAVLGAVMTVLVISCGSPDRSSMNHSIIPLPASIVPYEGSFTVNDRTLIAYDKSASQFDAVAELLSEALTDLTGFNIPVQRTEERGDSANLILLKFTDDLDNFSDEGYRLNVRPATIVIEASTGRGLFYGTQTLLQLISVNDADERRTIPAVTIEDSPRYRYRGMHLDVCRHFFSVEFVKRYIDLLAMYKMNKFHWHLTEDQGWRIEIKKYPRLTEIGAWRTTEDGEQYGGFYSQDDIREVVQYAAQRYIDVIPEIEMPGHAVAALAAYPELSCTGGPFEVQTEWGVHDDVYCAGKDTTFQFVTDVLDEVLELFPGRYIHIGGDECPKVRWEKCDDCQNRIRTEGLADEHELQSYFIKRIDDYLTEHGRRLIGWDEILEGGLAPEATVMSWRGMDGGIAAAKQGHDVIMTPTSHCYFDYYQADPEFEPEAIGGFTTLKKVYSFEPTPAVLSENEAVHLIGAQGNVWTEYIPTEKQAEYMTLPRMIALAEVVWSPQDARDWDDFRGRLEPHLDRLTELGYNFSRGSFRVEINADYDPSDKLFKITMDSEQPNAEIRYQLDGAEPTPTSPRYTGLISVDKSAEVRAAIFQDDSKLRGLSQLSIIRHLGNGCPIVVTNDPVARYSGGGPSGLVNGLLGSLSHSDKAWQGYEGNDLDATIDLGDEYQINSVTVRFLHNQNSWIFKPTEVQVAVSTDGGSFNKLPRHRFESNPSDTTVSLTVVEQEGHNVRARYVKVTARNVAVCPDWHRGAGGKAWLFVDQIIIK